VVADAVVGAVVSRSLRGLLLLSLVEVVVVWREGATISMPLIRFSSDLSRDCDRDLERDRREGDVFLEEEDLEVGGG